MTSINARTVLRSRNAAAPEHVLSTLLLRYPRWVHAEFMTHRQFSRNAASSRAIPINKLIQDVLDNPAIPIHWGKNQPGMQAHEECDAPTHIGGDIILTADEDTWMERRNAWLTARDCAVHIASAYADAGYHKQIVNRLLEPFAHVTVLVSATEWDNFLELRDHEDAEPHIAMLAREVRACLEREDDIQTLQPGEWHLPFTEDYDNEFGEIIKLSTARCASTSYKTVDGFDMTLERAIALHDKLVSSRPIHASPAEHVAQADELKVTYDARNHRTHTEWANPDQHRNFRGFRQYRAMIEEEVRVNTYVPRSLRHG